MTPFLRSPGTSHRRLMLVVAAVLAAGAVPSVTSAADPVVPLVGRMTYEAFVRGAGMDPDQRFVTEVIFSDYAAALEALEEEYEERLEAAGRARVHDVLAGRAFLELDELRRLRAGLERLRLEHWERADELARDLVDSTASLLMEPDGPHVDRAIADLRRTVYLTPRRARARDDDYAGDGVDLVALLAEFRAAEPDLADMDDADLAPALDAYVRDLDEHLRATARAERRDRADLSIARIDRDDAAEAAARAALLTRWRTFHAITERGARAVEAAIAASAPRAAATWTARFEAACFPRLYAASRPERELAWIAAGRRFPAGGDVRVAAADIVAAYRERVRELRREAATLMLEGRVNLGVVLHADMEPSALTDSAVRSAYERLLRNSGERSRLAADAAGAIEGLLSDRQRKQMRADLAAAAFGRRR